MPGVIVVSCCSRGGLVGRGTEIPLINASAAEVVGIERPALFSFCPVWAHSLGSFSAVALALRDFRARSDGLRSYLRISGSLRPPSDVPECPALFCCPSAALGTRALPARKGGRRPPPLFGGAARGTMSQWASGRSFSGPPRALLLRFPARLFPLPLGVLEGVRPACHTLM